MNAKKAKLVRRVLRQSGVDPTDARYRDYYDIRGRLVQRTLIPECGRAAYQYTKVRA